MLVDLIRLTAADGVELDGAFFEPVPGRQTGRPH